MQWFLFAANDELKRKMYGCILVVGGGMKFIGIGKWLQNRVGLQIPYLFRSEHLDIVTSPKEMDPAMTGMNQVWCHFVVEFFEFCLFYFLISLEGCCRYVLSRKCTGIVDNELRVAKTWT